MLKLRQEDEAKRLKMDQPPLPFAEVLAGIPKSSPFVVEQI